MSAPDGLFWAKVSKSDGCWVWTGAKNPAGYGVLRRWNGGNPANYLAHRYSLMQQGVELDGQIVDHICFNPACVRADHLRVVTNKQNHEHLSGANANSRTGVRGVSWDRRRGKWRAAVKHNYRLYSKSFDDFDDAAEWVLRKRLELFTHNDVDRAA